MTNQTQTQVLINKAVKELGTDAELIGLVGANTRLRISIDIVCGKTQVRKTVTHQKQGLSKHHRNLATDEPISNEEWEKILSLPAFSETSRYLLNRNMRETLLKFKEAGEVIQRDISRQLVPRINEALSIEEMPYRVVCERGSEGKTYEHYFRLAKTI